MRPLRNLGLIRHSNHPDAEAGNPSTLAAFVTFLAAWPTPLLFLLGPAHRNVDGRKERATYRIVPPVPQDAE
jgi:hypothetical protein